MFSLIIYLVLTPNICCPFNCLLLQCNIGKLNIWFRLTIASFGPVPIAIITMCYMVLVPAVKRKIPELASSFV